MNFYQHAGDTKSQGSQLRKFEGFLFDRRMEGCPPERLERRAGVIAELQKRYDHLAGVPPQPW
jgi:hypothetical protein